MGSDFNDRLYGSRGDNDIYGGKGNDDLLGGTGKDRLYGGAGADNFIFETASASPIGAPDTIGDFQRGRDTIELTFIDANTTAAAPGDQGFTYIGIALVFGLGQPGQLRLFGGVVYGETNGDAVADFAISVSGITALADSDFAL